MLTQFFLLTMMYVCLFVLLRTTKARKRYPEPRRKTVRKLDNDFQSHGGKAARKRINDWKRRLEENSRTIEEKLSENSKTISRNLEQRLEENSRILEEKLLETMGNSLGNLSQPQAQQMIKQEVIQAFSIQRNSMEWT